MRTAKHIIIFLILDICEPYIFEPNVGTVLFSPSDLNKDRWSKTEIGSLRARRHFQALIPPPKVTDTLDDQYLIHLMNYLQNSYKTIKSEAETKTEHDIMTNALSDVIGGYLKVWVLPITKYAYYGGTISPDNAIKLFETFNGIKSKLKTDGHSWRNPNEDLLQTVTINIASNQHDWYTRSTHDTCNNLSYYEKTDKGLTVPLPNINWDLCPRTMFIPMKNQSLIQLNSPNSPNALLDYYNIATSCIHSLNMGSVDDFGSRFQIWLSTDVVPHLNDDDLYVAFGSVLSLLNKTKSVYKDVVNLCDHACMKIQNKALLAGCPIVITKKTLLIALIVVIEILWCIPVLYYLLCVKRKRKRNFFNSFNRKSNRKNPLHGFKLFVKPKTRNLELDVEFPSYGHKYYMKSASTNVSHNNVHDKVSQSNESMKVRKTISDTKTSVFTTTEPSNRHICNCASINIPSTISSFTDNSTKTVTLIEESEIKNLSYTHATLSVSKSMCKCMVRNKSNKTISQGIMPSDKTLKRTSSSCIKAKNVETVAELDQKLHKYTTCTEKKSKQDNLTSKNPIVMKIMNPKGNNKLGENNVSNTRPTLNVKLAKLEDRNIPISMKINKNRDEKIIMESKKLPNITEIAMPKSKTVHMEIIAGERNKNNVYDKPFNNKDIIKPYAKKYNRAVKTTNPTEDKCKVIEIMKPGKERQQKTRPKKENGNNNLTLVLENKNFGHVSNVPNPKKSILSQTITNKANPILTAANIKKISTEKLEKSVIGQQKVQPKDLPTVTNVTNERIEKEIDKNSLQSQIKPSKIPRRIFAPTVPANMSCQKKDNSPRTLYRSCKKTLDDSAIKKTVNKTNKLNVTL